MLTNDVVSFEQPGPVMHPKDANGMAKKVAPVEQSDLGLGRFALACVFQILEFLYEGESIINEINLFLVEIHLFFFDVIALWCDPLRPTVFTCHQSRMEKVRVLSADPLLSCRHDFFVRPEMTSTDILFQIWE